MLRLFGKFHPKIVALGGGTGLSTMLRGLKERTDRITALVTVTDDGGSSGRIRKEFGMLPPGDIRNCLVALAGAGKIMEDLFQYRFGAESDLNGHSFGNLLLTALTQITGNFRDALREASKILNVRGQVLPACEHKVALVATHTDGTKSTGEGQLAKHRVPIAKLELRPVPEPVAPDIQRAIAEADLIVLGPGSLFTSVIPNLLVPGMNAALAKAKAPKVYVCNVMTQPGETTKFSVADHLRALEQHSAPAVMDYVVVNTAPIDERLVRKYQALGQEPVVADLRSKAAWPFRAVLRGVALVSESDVVRHDPKKLAEVLFKLLREHTRNAKRRRSPALADTSTD